MFDNDYDNYMSLVDIQRKRSSWVTGLNFLCVIFVHV